MACKSLNYLLSHPLQKKNKTASPCLVHVNAAHGLMQCTAYALKQTTKEGTIHI